MVANDWRYCRILLRGRLLAEPRIEDSHTVIEERLQRKTWSLDLYQVYEWTLNGDVDAVQRPLLAMWDHLLNDLGEQPKIKLYYAIVDGIQARL